MDIGDGTNASVWYDKWEEHDPLSNFIRVSNTDICDARFSKDACVADMVKEGLPVPFTIRGIWKKSMRTDYSEVEWYKVVWFTQCTPRHAFIMWLALHNRLQTQDRMAKWNNGTNLCPLCETCIVILYHTYSSGIMQNSYCNNSIKGVLGRIGVAACVYKISRERNLRLFQNSKRTEEDVVKCLKEEIRWKLMSLKVKRSQAVTKVFKQWDTFKYKLRRIVSVGGGCIEFGVCLHKGNVILLAEVTKPALWMMPFLDA
ncbi:reverse transcriptase zinc-binding domain-containing protein [Tanacetum coccineum]|uniref:Reverse transcriptase zinc-binding domain-containing protein n=1 Tax=Tanacetum coccineum TaxID=301880 RepID=A0ABQ5I9R8_9ASTR